MRHRNPPMRTPYAHWTPEALIIRTWHCECESVTFAIRTNGDYIYLECMTCKAKYSIEKDRVLRL